MPIEFPTVRVEEPGAATSLSVIAAHAARLLLENEQKVAVFESSTGGLLAAALQSCSGASKYITFNTVTYSKTYTAAILPGLKLDFPRPKNSDEYRASKNEWTASVSAQMRELVPDATWCVSESGACGPTFNYDGISTGFTSICVTGPVTKGVFVESDTADRERNMRLFVQAAIDLLSECITEAAETAARATPNAEAVPAAASTAAEPERFKTVNDRYGGVMATAISGVTATEFAAVLAQRIPAWKAEGKRGLWLKIPAECADLVGPAVSAGLAFHHAKPEYVQLTMWLPETSSPLPLYSFTQIGVGGVVVNSQGEVLMVQERVSPAEQYQGSWKLPGGLADPGESFAQTAQREVHEETGVTGELDGVVSLRHTHGVRFGQGDLYVLVRLRATSEKLVLDDHEIAVAEWMHPDRIKSLVEWDHTKMYKDKVSKTNWEMISNAVYGRLVSGTEMPSTRGASMLYVAS